MSGDVVFTEAVTITEEQQQLVAVWWQGGTKRHWTRDGKKTLCHLWIPGSASLETVQQSQVNCRRCQMYNQTPKPT